MIAQGRRGVNAGRVAVTSRRGLRRAARVARGVWKRPRSPVEMIYGVLAIVASTSDGTCNNICTAGKRGDACTADADCDFYKVDLTL